MPPRLFALNSNVAQHDDSGIPNTFSSRFFAIFSLINEHFFLLRSGERLELYEDSLDDDSECFYVGG